MPGMTGYELLKKIKVLAAKSCILVLFFFTIYSIVALYIGYSNINHPKLDIIFSNHQWRKFLLWSCHLTIYQQGSTSNYLSQALAMPFIFVSCIFVFCLTYSIIVVLKKQVYGRRGSDVLIEACQTIWCKTTDRPADEFGKAPKELKQEESNARYHP